MKGENMNQQEINDKLNYYKNNNEIDKLEALFDLQNTFDQYIVKVRNLDYSDYDYWIPQMCRCITVEANELMDCFNWKHWKNKKKINWENVREETIDLWHFLLSLSIKIGLKPQDVLNQYINKNLENYNRQIGKSEREGYEFNQSKL